MAGQPSGARANGVLRTPLEACAAEEHAVAAAGWRRLLREGERVMPTYVGLYTWTDQGIRNVKDTVKRVEEARAAFEKSGARVIAIYWTQGRYDLVSIAEFPDEETASAGALALGMAGNVHTETLRAFSAEEIQRVLDKLP